MIKTYDNLGCTEQEFNEVYDKVLKQVTDNKEILDSKCTIILGGQPGSGKSSFYHSLSNKDDYITIDGDEYRSYHPRINEFTRTDIDEYVERTQPFTNAIVEGLINDLSQKGYNVIVEGTLRTAEVPINTCNIFNKCGYNTNLVIVSCDAEKSWLSTIDRAKYQIEKGIPTRLVPIDKFDYIVKNISKNLDIIKENGCFDNIKITNRLGEELYNSDKDISITPGEVLKNQLNLENWDAKYSYYEKDYIEQKISLLKQQLEVLNHE